MAWPGQSLEEEEEEVAFFGASHHYGYWVPNEQGNREQTAVGTDLQPTPMKVAQHPEALVCCPPRYVEQLCWVVCVVEGRRTQMR